MTAHDDFGQWRALLSRPPTKEGLLQLARSLDGYDEAVVQSRWGHYLWQEVVNKWHQITPWSCNLQLESCWCSDDLFTIDEHQLQQLNEHQSPSRMLYRTFSAAMYPYYRSIEHLNNITIVECIDSDMDNEALNQLINTPHHQPITHWYLSTNTFDEQGVMALCQSHHAQHIQWLGLSNNHISAHAMEAILSLPALKALNLSEFTGDEVAIFNTLTTHPGTQKLTHLAINDLQFDDRPDDMQDALSTFLGAISQSKLRSLSIQNSCYESEPIEALFEHGLPRHLQELFLDGTPLSDTLIDALSTSPNALTYMSFTQCPGEGIERIFYAKTLNDLEHLDLRWTPWTTHVEQYALSLPEDHTLPNIQGIYPPKHHNLHRQHHPNGQTRVLYVPNPS